MKHKEVEYLPEEKLPIGFKRINNHPYLDGRGFNSEQYELFQVGMTNSPMEPQWRNKVIFQIFNNNIRVGVLGRSTKSKQWHDDNMINHKEGGRLVLRYKNSDGDFSKMVGGLDEITDSTHTVIIVEGLMDKANVDRQLKLLKDPLIKCLYVFGSNISEYQINLLKAFKQVQTVIILFDPDTLKKVRNHVARLVYSHNWDVKIGVIKSDNDPGEMSKTEILDVLMNSLTPLEFYSNELIIKKLNI